jgi:hypothetical protein
MSAPGDPAPNRLETTMQRVAAGDAPESEFFRVLYESDVVLPDPAAPRAAFAEPRRPAEGEDLQLPMGTVGDTSGLVAYSSSWQLRHALGEDQPSVVLPMALLRSMWHSEVALLLNPGGTLGTRLDAIQVRALPGTPPERIGRLGEGSEVVPRDPTAEERAALEALWERVASLAPVSAAYAAGFRSEAGERLAVGLVVDDWRLANDVMLDLGDFRLPLPAAQLLAVDPEGRDELSAQLLQAGVRVWERRPA